MRFLRRLWDKLLIKLWYFKYKEGRRKNAIREVMALTQQAKIARGVTRTVRIAANFPGLWARTFDLTPQGRCQWGKTLFTADGKGDLAFVINSVRQPQPGNTYLPKIDLPERERAWALHMEPEEYVRKLGYDDPAEHAAFSRFYTSCPSLLAQGGIYRPAPPYVHFHLNKTWDELEAVSGPPRKRLQLGIIMSGLRNVEGHHTRFRFLEALNRSGLEYGFWGRGENLDRYRGYRGFAVNKWDVHAACRYSIVLENSVTPYYWSEKPADALLAWSLPLYHGCPNLDQYLPSDSYIRLDISRPQEAIETIVRVINEDPYEDRLAAIAEARRRLLHEQHLYAFIDREVDSFLHA